MRRIIALAAAMAVFATPVMSQGTIKANPNDYVIKPDEKTDVHFRNCTEARAAGYSRMRAGQRASRPSSSCLRSSCGSLRRSPFRHRRSKAQ